MPQVTRNARKKRRGAIRSEEGNALISNQMLTDISENEDGRGVQGPVGLAQVRNGNGTRTADQAEKDK